MVIGVLGAPNAGAHSTLIEACPSGGDVINEVTSLELTFSSPLFETEEQPATLELVVSGTDDALEIGPAEFVTDRILRATVPDDLAPGLYVVRYQVLSIDNDLNDGGFQFTLDPTASSPDECGAADSGGSSSGGWILLGGGVVALAVVGFLLRPRRSTNR